MDKHIPQSRLLDLAGDVPPETEELKHLLKCQACFDLLTSIIRDSRNERSTGTTGS
jgi:hypothetical protein